MDIDAIYHDEIGYVEPFSNVRNVFNFTNHSHYRLPQYHSINVVI